jgi:lipopolysaccharide export system protein LptC
MNSARSALRFRLVVILAVAGFMALGSLWLNMVIKKSQPDSQSMSGRTEPDYFVYDFNYVKMLPSGLPQYHLTGKQLTHYPADDSFLINLPVYRGLEDTKPPQTVRSDHAIVKDDNTKVHMYGNVKLDRLATAKTEAFHLATEYLLVFPDEDSMRTDKPVTIQRGYSTMNGIGMFANNATGEMRLFHQSRVMMAPRK